MEFITGLTCGIFLGAMGMFVVMISVIMSREWERLQKEAREEKP